MSVRLRESGYLSLAILCGSSLVVQAQKPAVADVLKGAGDYLLQYSQKLSTLAAEEEYTQREPSAGNASRRLQSDIVLIGLGGGMITGFRDVVAIDGREVRQRDERLLKLFQEPPTEARQAQALAWWDEGVRYYMSPNLRTLDFPTVALEFLRSDNQDQSVFSLDGVRDQGGAQVATVKFQTAETSRVLPTPEGFKTTGRAWVEVGSGAIRQTELLVGDKHFSFKATTKYAFDPTLGMWLPSELLQIVNVSTPGSGGFSNMGAGGNMGARQSLEGRAGYTKYRRPKP